MKYFHGFALANEEYLLEPFLSQSDMSVSGFSYGAIKAFEYVQKELELGVRIDRLQLFSPAFFQTKDEKFKRLQLMAYRKNEEVYLRQFLNACFLPHEKKNIEQSVTTLDELEELLYYEWKREKLQILQEQGVEIEVYLGEADGIIDAAAAYEFFQEFATVTYIKNANHFLLTH